MKTITLSEQEDNFRLAKAKEFLAHSKEMENQCRRELTAASEQTKRAREKLNDLFQECEKRAVARLNYS